MLSPIPVPLPRVINPILPFAPERVLPTPTPPHFKLFNLGAKCSVYGSPAILFWFLWIPKNCLIVRDDF